MLDFNKITNSLGKLGDAFDKVNPLNYIRAGKSALKEFWKDKDKSWKERFELTIKAYKDEWAKIDQEKAGVKAETKDTSGKVIDSSLEAFNAIAPLPTGATELEKGSHNLLLASTKAGFDELDGSHQGYAKSAIDKMAQEMAGGTVSAMTADEITSFTAVGLSALKKLKNSIAKDEFKKKFKEICDISDKSKFPFAKVFGEKFVGIFTLQGSDQEKFVGMIGVESSMGDSVMGAEGDVEEGQRHLDALKSKDFNGQRQETVDFLCQYVFPATAAKDKKNVETLAEKINAASLTKSGKMDAETLADIILLIEDADFDKLAKNLSGK